MWLGKRCTYYLLFLSNKNIGKGKENMRINKLKIFATIVIALMMTSVMMIENNLVRAQTVSQPQPGPLPTGATPDTTLSVVGAFLSVTPSPLGIGQQLLVNMWIIPPTARNRQFNKAYELTITKPDGSQAVIGPMDSFAGDATAWTNYVPDQIGTFKFKFDFLGQYFPAGYYYNGINYPNIAAMPAADLAKMAQTTYGSMSAPQNLGSAYYKPTSSQEVDVVVQQNPIASWTPTPLPTDYWTRPAYSENREWWPILGNSPPTGIIGGGPNWPANTNIYMNNYGFVPYVQAPNTAHVVWKRQGAFGGLVGGSKGQITYDLFAGTGEIGFPAIIYNGRCYQTVTKVNQTAPTSQDYWQCYDLRTGQVYWERPIYPGETMPTFIEYASESEEVPGAEARVGTTIYLDALTGSSGTNSGRILKYNPWNGALLVNITGLPPGVSGTTLYGYPYVLSVQTIGSGASATYRLINWTIENSAGPGTAYTAYGLTPVTDNFTSRIVSNTTWPFSSLGTADFQAGLTVNTGAIIAAGTGVQAGTFIMGASLTTGQLLYNITLNADNGYNQFTGINPRADHGKFATRNRDGSYYWFDMATGKFLWKSPLSSYPWGVWEAYNVESAYGYIYMTDYAGVSAIDWNTGNIVWQFIAPTPFPFETPYDVNGTGTYSFHSAGLVADGKLYVVNTEHSPSQPLTRGWRLFCLNATTGNDIWNISNGQGAPGSRIFQGAIADGYLAMTNEYNGYMYVYGKGISDTTVSAPQTAITQGTSIVIEGTVLDQSPAQTGKPCVSADSMSTEMEYLHMQYPIDGIHHNVTMTGVPVTLTALDSNGNSINIGTAITDAYYGTFSKTWTPQTAGDYKIIASFAGDDSYGSSGAATALTVAQAPSASTTSTTSLQSAPDNTMVIIASALAVIIAVAIVGALMMMTFKRRP